MLARLKEFSDFSCNGNTRGRTDALEDGCATGLIFNHLEALQGEPRRLSEELARGEREIEKATVKCPTTAQVCAAWGQIIELGPS